MQTIDEFVPWFAQATGHEPYPYQRALAEAREPPTVLELPTGSGKTQAIVGAWLFRRLAGVGPRRLVYALPMRSLVEQTVEVAVAMRHRLEIEPADLPVHVLMGGEEPAAEDWRLRPDAEQILVGTIDMLLSRALNRGYAENRFAWPVAFGLLNADCRWVFDEVQLMGPARATSAQLDGLRAALGTALPCETTCVSATVDRTALTTVDRPDVGAVMSLSEKDRSGRLAKRLNACKRIERIDIAGAGAAALPRSIADLALQRHVPGTRTLVVLNTVERAQATFEQLAQLAAGEHRPGCILLHSRFRPPERWERMAQALTDPIGPGTIVVATQVVEAGVDMSSRTLVTEPAPFSSIVQRLGRLNREGEHAEANLLWLDVGPVADDSDGRKAAAPYTPLDVETTRASLLEFEGRSLSPAALEEIEVPETADDPAVLRRRDLLDLFDTTPDISGMDIDVAPFIRDDDERSVAVLFRDLPPDAAARIADQPAPERDELVQVPQADLRDRACWVIDHVDAEWLRRPGRDVPPGSTVMLRSADGGYDSEIGWRPKEKRAVPPIQISEPRVVEGFVSDTKSQTGAPQDLLAHLTDAAAEASTLAQVLALEQWHEVLHAAASLHDLGKAHPVFQKTLRSMIDSETHPDRDHVLWAKSGGRGGRHERRYFRHELASALAVAALEEAIELPSRQLTAYLIAAHHGKVRLSIRPAPNEDPPEGADGHSRFALGVIEGDGLPEVETPLGTTPPVTLSLACMELGAEESWTRSALRLRDDRGIGPFRLAYLEALLRVADWRASA